MPATPILALPYPTGTDAADAVAAVKPLADRLEALLTQSGAFVVGEIRWLARSSTPPLWVPADGAPRSRTTYALLWAAVSDGHAGTTVDPAPWGNGDGATTFNVPDLRGRAPVGVGTPAGGSVEASPPTRVIGRAFGVNVVALTDPRQNAYHAHSDSGHYHTPGTGGAYAVTTYPAGLGADPGAQPGWFPDQYLTDTGWGYANIQPSGGGMTHDNTQPSVGVPAFVYAGV